MTLTKERVTELAHQLITAQTSLVPIPPLTETDEGITVEDAYRVQLAVLEHRLGTGRKVVGKKVGLTSLAMQQMLGVSEPDYGLILDNMLIEDGIEYPANRLIAPRVEPEIAFKLKAGLQGPNVTMEQVLEATDYVFPAIELIDSRIKDWKIKLPDTIADNASSAGVIVGSNRLYLEGVDLPAEEVVLEKNGEEVGRAKGEAVLGHPAKAVAWVTNKLHDYGISMNAGDIIMPGALTGAATAQAGDTIRATFTNVGSVSIRFV